MSDVTQGSEGYDGSSKDEEPDRPPELKYAITNAYRKGMAAKPDADRTNPDGTPRTFVFEVVKIFIEGTNPPSDYRVRVKDHP